MTANTPHTELSPIQELLQPLKEIMAIVGADTAEQAVEAVRGMNADLLRLDSLLGSLSVAPVVLANGRPLFVQLPPSVPQHQYHPEAIEMVRDALVEASVSLRSPLARSRAAQTRLEDKGHEAHQP